MKRTPRARRARARASPLAILNRIARLATEDLALRPMQQRIADALAEHFGWEFVALVSVDAERGRFVCEALATALPTVVHVGYSRKLGSGIVGRVALDGEPVLVSDARAHPGFVHTLPGGRAELCMPVRHRGETVAVLNLESRTAGAFDDQVELVATIAAQIAGAIAAARRFEALERRAAQLELVAEITRRALGEERLDALLERVLGDLASHFATAEATVLLESDVRDWLEVMAHVGASGHITHRTKLWPVASGVVGRCFRSGEPVHVPDVRADSDYAIVNPAVMAELAVPIRIDDRVLGVLNLESTDPNAFDYHQRLMVRAIADQLAGAIHLAATNRRLLDARERHVEQQQRLQQTHASLQRAIGKLERSARHTTAAGLPDVHRLARWLRSERRAVERGGRAVAVALLETVRDEGFAAPLAAADRLERALPVLKGRVAQLDARTLAAVFSGADEAPLRALPAGAAAALGEPAYVGAACAASGTRYETDALLEAARAALVDARSRRGSAWRTLDAGAALPLRRRGRPRRAREVLSP